MVDNHVTDSDYSYSEEDLKAFLKTDIDLFMRKYNIGVGTHWFAESLVNIAMKIDD